MVSSDETCRSSENINPFQAKFYVKIARVKPSILVLTIDHHVFVMFATLCWINLFNRIFLAVCQNIDVFKWYEFSYKYILVAVFFLNLLGR